MKITLKKFAHYPRISEETIAYVADRWIDGIFYGQTSNEGHGAPDSLHHEAITLLDAYAKTLPDEEIEIGNGETVTLKPSWESVMLEAVQDAIRAKQSKKPWIKIVDKKNPIDEPIYWSLSRWTSLAKQLWNNPSSNFIQKKKSELLLGSLHHGTFALEVINGSQVPAQYLGE